MKLKRMFNISFVVAFFVLVGAGVLVYREQEKRIEREASAHLKTMLMLRESVLRGHLESLRSEVRLWSSQGSVIDILLRLTANYRREGEVGLGAVGRTSVNELKGTPNGSEAESLDERVAEFAAHHHYYDIFFISTAGDILYTVAREKDHGTSLANGPYADSGLGRLFRGLRATSDRDQVVFEDFSRYGPSNNEPAAFMGSAVYFKDRVIGFYAVQIPVAPIDTIMQFSAGMGETGETYLVGRDRLMRSDSRFFEESTILRTTVSGSTVDLALEGEIGISIVDDYRGIPVFSAYRPFDFEGTRWAVLAEKDVAEVFAPARESLQWILIGYGVIIIVGLLVRFMLLHVVAPTALGALGAFLGFSMMDSIDDS